MLRVGYFLKVTHLYIPKELFLVFNLNPNFQFFAFQVSLEATSILPISSHEDNCQVPESVFNSLHS